MPDKVTISHRGARYEIGRGKRYYGIWVAGAPESAPIDRWPETREGWAQAWTRFVSIEAPGTISTVEQPRSGFKLPGFRLPRTSRAGAGPSRAPLRTIAAALLGLGVVLGIAGLFPDYFTGQSLASQGDQLVPHLLYLAGWAASTVLVVRGGTRARIGALLGIGLSAVTLGLFLSDLGQVISGSSGLEAGLVIGIVGWALCTAGAGVGLALRPPAPAVSPAPADLTGAPYTETPVADTPVAETPVTETPVAAGPAAWRGGPVRPTARHAGPAALLVLGAIGTIAAFAPSWDSYTLSSPSTGTQTYTLGNAFGQPGAVIAGNVAVMIAVVAVAVLAALWRPMRQGAALLAGAVIPMAAQAISALIQVTQPTPPSEFGVSQSEASALGLTITNGLTPIFWVYCVFVIALLISCAWLVTEPVHPDATASTLPAWPGPIGGPIPPLADDSGENTDENADDTGESDDGITADTAAETRGETGDDNSDNDGGPEDDAEDDEENTYA